MPAKYGWRDQNSPAAIGRQKHISWITTKFGRPALRATYPEENAIAETTVTMCAAVLCVSTSAAKQLSPRSVEYAVAPMKYSRSQRFTFDSVSAACSVET